MGRAGQIKIGKKVHPPIWQDLVEAQARSARGADGSAQNWA
jgi:hypothetical protein